MFLSAMQADELYRLAEIDRSEAIEASYQLQNGQLVLIADAQLATGFTAEELSELMQRQSELLQAGGKIMGAFEQDKLVGMASVALPLFGRDKSYCKMDILYVSRPHRGQGIAKQLLHSIKIIARTFEASHLYISATPTQHTVDFYLAQGAQLATEINPQLWAMEPDDIHLELPL
ncbi:GNAT family N-acetyltransferase [Pedobacter sp. KR3-3]|uniref:GNAT family N-acetyltransferase n=1 Tax=Pedobacter albus TaxID=3113905 RepID=A0ABU7IAW1_9SPHI|nr:GNAT family N-acetyltransferase [Pedobacter sp. KR3-3]MEE1946625.1 GNAT family N-acetyltransferase [Pedobacter sp. KR3-3]